MINKIITDHLSSYLLDDKKMSSSQRSYIEHLIINKIFQLPYFDKIEKLNLYTNGIDILSFYKDIVSNENLLDTDFHNLGAYIFNEQEHSKMIEIQEILNNANKIEDLAGVFDESNAALINKTFPSLRNNPYTTLVALSVFIEKCHNDKEFKLNYNQEYGQIKLQTEIEKFIVGDKFRYSTSEDCPIKKHLTHNMSEINQKTLSDDGIAYLLRAENRTIQAIFQNKFTANEDDNKRFEDLTSILSSPAIREGTNIGILFDDTITGYDKLAKLYNKNMFKTVKASLLNEIDFKLDSLVLENYEEKYKTIIDKIMNDVLNQLPILNINRDSPSPFIIKDEINYAKLFENQGFKSFGLSSHSFFEYETRLINTSLSGYLNRALDVSNIRCVNSNNLVGVTGHSLVNYHNGVETLLTVKTSRLKNNTAEADELIPFIIVDNFISPTNNIEQTAHLLNEYINDVTKNGLKVLLNKGNSSSYFHEKVLELVEQNSNVVICKMRETFFTNSLNNLMTVLRRDDKLSTSQVKDDFLIECLTSGSNELKIIEIREMIDNYQPKVRPVNYKPS